MTRALAFVRRYWKHLAAGHAAAAAIIIAILFALGVFAGAAAYKTIFGVKLNHAGVHIYDQLAQQPPEKGGHLTREVVLTPAQLAKLKASAAAAAKQLHPNVQATPEPAVLDQPIPRNFYAGRAAGAKYLLLVVHDTESPNAPGIQDLEAIRAWFSNPNAQASANYVDDTQGNTLQMVDPATETAWHVAYFNQWAIGVEQVGYASQTKWPLLQVEATARVFAHWATTYGIPIRRGKVNGCTIVKPGIVFHADLGLCGGGHHDPGPNYPIAELIRLTAMYASAGKPPKRHHHKPVHHVKVPAVTLQIGAHGAAVKLLQRALDEHGAHLRVDGDYGHATLTAVEHFQTQHHLAVDGVVGLNTRRYLNR
jgi:N-acetyl-anhydromuramyl-L-alanine amidase AmpD